MTNLLNLLKSARIVGKHPREGAQHSGGFSSGNRASAARGAAFLGGRGSSSSPVHPASFPQKFPALLRRSTDFNRFLVATLLAVACTSPFPAECSPAAICPGATSIDLDAGAPPFTFADGGRVGEGSSWWLCTCDGYGWEWHIDPTTVDWGDYGLTAKEACLIYRREWDWCPLSDARDH